MILFSPTITRALIQSNCPELILEKNVDFWYDTLNKCYKNQMSIDMICNYVAAINNEEAFDYWYNNLDDYFNEYDKKQAE